MEQLKENLYHALWSETTFALVEQRICVEKQRKNEAIDRELSL